MIAYIIETCIVRLMVMYSKSVYVCVVIIV